MVAWKNPFLPVLVLLVGTSSVALTQVTNSITAQAGENRLPELRPLSEHSIWKNDQVGGGLRRWTHHAGFTLGAGWGFKPFPENEIHNIALGRAQYGWILSDVVAKDHWFRGNWEILGEVFGGAQFNRSPQFIIGVTPVLRYNFATGTRWLPFIDIGAGVAATSIREPDLSTLFEFSVHGGPGVEYFLTKNTAVSLQYRFFHLSNAGIETPNLGIYVNMICAGLAYYF